MEQKEIIEGNKLIAEFMATGNQSYQCQIRGTKFSGSIFNYFKKPLEMNEHMWQNALLHYHSSWDWLMPVVGRIEKLGFDSRIMGNDSDSGFLCDFVDYENREAACVLCYQHDGGTKIECVFKAVTEFIRWYNSAPHKKTG